MQAALTGRSGLLIIILDGLGSTNGVVAGVFLFVVVRVLLTTYKWELKSALHLPFEAVWLEYMIFGVLMLLVLIFKPEGLLREKPTMTKPIREVVKRTRKGGGKQAATADTTEHTGKLA